jgi:hypothetical protein
MPGNRYWFQRLRGQSLTPAAAQTRPQDGATGGKVLTFSRAASIVEFVKPGHDGGMTLRLQFFNR